MEKCKEAGVNWAIFSDHYGVWFSGERHKWYGDDVGDPDRVTEQKFHELVADFETKLDHFQEVYFYYNPGRFHPLYKRLLRENKLRERIAMFTHISEIV